MKNFSIRKVWGTWVAQLVKHVTSVQVIISWFLSSSPTGGSLLSVQRPTALDPLPPSLSAPPLLSLSKINKVKEKRKV